MQRWLQRWCAWSVWQYSASQCTAVHRWPSSCSIRSFIFGSSGLRPCKWYSSRSVHRWPDWVLWYCSWDAWQLVRRDTKCIERGVHVSVAVFHVQWYVSISLLLLQVQNQQLKLCTIHSVFLFLSFVWHAQFMAITYILNIIWSIMFCFLCIVTFVYTIFWRMCSENIEDNPRPCLIDLAQFRK